MITTIHTFGRDLKWNPHIHCLIPELIYSFKKDKIKTFHHFNFTKLRKTFQFELIRLIQEAGGLKKTEEKTDSIKTILKDSMSMPSSNLMTTILTMLQLIKTVKIFKAA